MGTAMSDGKTLRFVLHQEIEKYEAMGYRFASYIGGHHGQYSVIMEKADGLVPRNNKNIVEQKNRLLNGEQTTRVSRRKV